MYNFYVHIESFRSATQIQKNVLFSPYSLVNPVNRKYFFNVH